MAGKPFFDAVNPNPDFPKMERELLSKWEKSGIVKKYLTKNSKRKKHWSFLDGPITANNPMGVHHAWGRTYKDLFQRYKNMQGYRQRFQNGFDEQGLWVEVEVEKELGLKSKRDIENLVEGDVFRSIAKFVDLCRARVQKFAGIQTEESKRLGYFMDWNNSYHTGSSENNYMIWHFLKKCFERGLIYKGLDSVPWCPRCATAISQHEVLTEDYQELTHKAVYIRYPIARRQNEFLLVWTTTPWTLPGNVAIAVNPDLVYSKIRVGRDIFYIAKDRIIPVFGTSGIEVLEEIVGRHLISLQYTGPFDDLPAVDTSQRENPRTFHRTLEAKELVTATEGTGLVHIAPGAGHEDFILGRENKLPVIHLIDEFANFLPGLGEISGGKTSDPKKILRVVQEKGFLVREEDYTHRYPVCWRCKSELVFRAVPEWYIAMGPLRDEIIEVAKKIHWKPVWGLDREIDWLRNMDDWLISKKRYWGLALPIWECGRCLHFTVIGSREEIKEKAIEGWDKFSSKSPHRPWVDQIKIRCERCNDVASRIPDVGNPWLDAGIVPFSTITEKAASGKVSYTTDKKYWSEWFPADFITESFPGQFKNWFYSLLTMSTVLENMEPFKTVLGFASLMDERGEIMHKSKGNMIEFNEGADKIGVDVMRFLYVKQDPARNLLFGYKLTDETRRGFHLPLWNIYNFFVTYASFDSWEPKKTRSQKLPAMSNVLDKWILARLKQVVNIATESLDRYDAATASRVIEEFVSDLSTWYIRRCRDRVGPTADDERDKKQFYGTCYFVLLTLSKVLAPFIPFLPEWIYTNLTKEESVHLSDWPELPKPEKREEAIMEFMYWVRRAAEAGHATRKNSGIKVRQPLSRAAVGAPVKSPTKPYLAVLADELNVKDVKWTRKRVETTEVALVTKVSPILVEEGKTRDLVREIQDLRRRKGLELGDRVRVVSPWLPQDKKLLIWVKLKTLADEVEAGTSLGVQKV